MRSHCKAMWYWQLVNCFGTAGVDIHTASNVLAMVLPLCLQRSEGDGTCLPPVGWNLDDCQGPECWLEGHAPLGLPYSAAWHHIVTFCKFWEWLAVTFRIQRSSFFMLKPLMRSHCNYRKLANCFGRDSRCRHSPSKQRFSVGALTLFATLGSRWHLPPACWLKSRRLQRLRVLIRGLCVIGAALALPDITWKTKLRTCVKSG